MSKPMTKVERYRVALQEITYRKGAYSTDPLEHAGNVIDSNARIAQDALDGKELEI